MVDYDYFRKSLILDKLRVYFLLFRILGILDAALFSYI